MAPNRQFLPSENRIKDFSFCSVKTASMNLFTRKTWMFLPHGSKTVMLLFLIVMIIMPVVKVIVQFLWGSRFLFFFVLIRFPLVLKQRLWYCWDAEQAAALFCQRLTESLLSTWQHPTHLHPVVFQPKAAKIKTLKIKSCVWKRLVSTFSPKCFHGFSVR